MASINEVITRILILITTLVSGIFSPKSNLTSTTTTIMGGIQVPVELSVDAAASFCNTTHLVIFVINYGVEGSGPVSVGVTSPRGITRYCYIPNINPGTYSHCTVSREDFIDIGYYRVVVSAKNSTSRGLLYCANVSSAPQPIRKVPQALDLDELSFCNETHMIIGVRNVGTESTDTLTIRVESPSGITAYCNIPNIEYFTTYYCVISRERLNEIGHYKVIVYPDIFPMLIGEIYCNTSGYNVQTAEKEVPRFAVDWSTTVCNQTHIAIGVINTGTKAGGPAEITIISPTFTIVQCTISEIYPGRTSYCVIDREKLTEKGLYKIIARVKNHTVFGNVYCGVSEYSTMSISRILTLLTVDVGVSYCNSTHIGVGVRNEGVSSSGPVGVVAIHPTKNVFVGCIISDIPPGHFETCAIPRDQILIGGGYYRIIASSSTSNATGAVYCVV